MRTIRVFPHVIGNWLLQVEDDWDAMTEDQRQEYIYEAALDNGKTGGFDYADNPEVAK